MAIKSALHPACSLGFLPTLQLDKLSYRAVVMGLLVGWLTGVAASRRA